MIIGIGTRWFINITILLTFDIPFVFYDDIVIDREWPISTLNNVIAATNTDVDVTKNDVEITTLGSENVDESTKGSTSD